MDLSYYLRDILEVTSFEALKTPLGVVLEQMPQCVARDFGHLFIFHIKTQSENILQRPYSSVNY